MGFIGSFNRNYLRMKNTIITILFSLIAFVALSQTQTTEKSEKQREQFEKFKNELQIFLNEPVVNFSLKDTFENIVQLKEFKDKILILDFWFTSCAPCIMDFPYLKKLQTHYKDSSNIIFISICIDNDERKQVWKGLIHKHELGGIQVFLPKNRQNSEENQYYIDNIKTFPTCLLVSKSGKILGDLPNLDSFVAAYAIENGFQEKSTAQSVEEAFNKSESFNKWVIKNQNYVMGYF